jgi:hypothetical protein
MSAPPRTCATTNAAGPVAFEGTAQHRRHGEVDLERYCADRHQGQRHRDALGHFAAQGCGQSSAAAHGVDLVRRRADLDCFGIAQPVGRQGSPPGERIGFFGD